MEFIATLFLALLALLLIGLKLAAVGVVATWSWVSVLSPLWIPALIIAVLYVPIVMVQIVERVWRR